MSNNHPDMEVTFNDVVLAVVRRWRSLLAAALIAALLLGGIQGAGTLHAASDPARREQAEKTYQQQMNTYEEQVAAQEKTIARLEENTASQREYIEHSTLMSMDSGKVWTARATYYIDTEERSAESLDPIGALLAGYQVELRSSRTAEALGRAIDMEPQYITELMRVFVGSSGETDRVLSVAVSHSDKDAARTAMKALERELERIHSGLERQVEHHGLNRLSQSLDMENDRDIYKRQVNELDLLEDLEADLDEARKALSGIEKPHRVVLSVSGAVKTGVKFAVIGAVIGLVAAAAVICLRYLLGDRVYSGPETVRRTGIRLLGSIEKNDSPRCAADAAILRLQGRQQLPREEAAALAAADIGSYGAGMKTVLLCGEVTEQARAEVMDLLQDKLPGMTLCAAGCVTREARAARTLGECDGVVLLAQAGASRCSELRRQMAKCESLEKTLLGCIVLEK